MRRLLLVACAVAVLTVIAAPTSSAQANTVTPHCSPAPTDCSGAWYDHAVDLTWTFDPDPPDSTDCVEATINETAAAGQEVTCSATWGADTEGGDVTIHVDLTDPTVDGANPDVSANGAGWFNQPVSWDFFGSDALSGLDGPCSQNVAYSGPDSATASVSGTCTDNAGNSHQGSKSFKYDATDPSTTASSFSRGTDHGTWFNHTVTVNFTGTDNLSGVANPCHSVPYSGPDGTGIKVSGACTDAAGNTDPSPRDSAAFNYDDTNPATTGATADRAANANGWYNAPVSVDFHGTDATSGIASCSSGVTYSGPDDASASVSGTCTDNAGNTDPTPFSKGLKYDATNPTVTNGTAESPADGTNNWYTTAPTYDFTGTDNLSGIDSCPSVAYAGGDSATASVTGFCTDKAGNTSGGLVKSFKFDHTDPGTTGSSFSRGADHTTAGVSWFNHTVTVNFTGTDATSGVANPCAHSDYSGPDGTGVHVSGACVDAAGNTDPSTLASSDFNYDGTKPTVASPTAGRLPDSNGWYNHAVTFTWNGTDATSGIDTCDQKSYSGPAGSSLSLPGTCTDKAGNQGDSTSATLSYDATPPTAPTADTSRPADQAGWWNHSVTVNFIGSTDANSGVASCSAPITYTGPDAASVSESGHCTDEAGNSSANATKVLKFDATAPTVTSATPARATDANGWFNHPIAFTFAGTDATSGIGSCTTTTPYSGPDSAIASVSGTCTDVAGNTSNTANQSFKYDSTPPDTTGATLARAPDQNGWYNHPVGVNLTGTDNLSNFAGGSATNCGSISYSGPDATGTHATGACIDQAGNTDPSPVNTTPFNYDATPPSVLGATPGRGPDSNGWYNHPVGFAFQGSDATSGVATCSSGVVYGGPDGAGASVSGSCQDNAGNAGSGAVGLRYDATAPRVFGALPDRLPDHDGWFNHPVKLRFVGADSTSGLAGCSSYTYNGPQNGNTRVSGTCTDAAGNSSTASFPMRYDATPPAPALVVASPQNGKAVVTWSKPADAAQVRVMRSLQGKARESKVYSGKATSFVDRHLRNGKHYVYTVVVTDEAGNQTSSTATVTPTSLSLRPLPGAVVSLAPKLSWKHVKRTRYYNLQLYLGRTKVLSTWPKTNSFQVQQSWLYAGNSYSLVPGQAYTWYVWPGIGPRRKNHYGHLLGKSTFTVLG